MGLVEKLKDLILLMNENDLAEIEVEEEGTKIRLKKDSVNAVQANVQLPALKAPLHEGGY